VHYNNEHIRQHCLDHSRWLFDFADIGAYDPDDNYFRDYAMAATRTTTLQLGQLGRAVV
jgi:hypothetical protein